MMNKEKEHEIDMLWGWSKAKLISELGRGGGDINYPHLHTQPMSEYDGLLIKEALRRILRDGEKQ